MKNVTLVIDYDNMTWRWHSSTSGFFGPEFETEHDARRWFDSYINSV